MTTTATALRMVRGDVDLREFNRWMGTRRFQDPDHAMHCLLKECFGDFYTNKNSRRHCAPAVPAGGDARGVGRLPVRIYSR